MTDEQILQNAEQHVIELFLHGDSRYYEKNGFVAGAHSRDKEIKDLQLAYHNLVNSFNEMERELAKASQELDQLRNSWISVEERLPEIDREVYLYHYGHFEIARRVVCKDRIYNRDGTHSDTIEWQISHGTSYSNISEGDYWMPIPSLKRDEEDLDDPRLTEKQKKELGYK